MDNAFISYLLYILSGLLGIVVLVIMAFSIKSNKLVNFFLFTVFFISSIRLLIMGTYGIHLQGVFDDFRGPYKMIPLLNVPLLFLYFKSIAEDQRLFKLDFLKHFIAPVIYFVFLAWYYQSTYFGHQAFKSLNFTFAVSFMFIYLLKSLYVLNYGVWKNNFIVHSEHFKLMRNWTFFLFLIAVLLFVRVTISFVLDLANSDSISGNTYYTLHSLIWMAVFVKVLISPEILFGLPHLTKKLISYAEKKEKLDENWYFENITISNQQDIKLKSKLDDRLASLIEEMEFLIKDQHYFRNQKITISDVANELTIPVSHLVYLFKYHSKMTFTEYKTFYKIEDAKRLIEDGFLGRNTLESLAAEVGFSSYNPFFTAFKKLNGLSPNDYALRLSNQNQQDKLNTYQLNVVSSKSVS